MSELEFFTITTKQPLEDLFALPESDQSQAFFKIMKLHSKYQIKMFNPYQIIFDKEHQHKTKDDQFDVYKLQYDQRLIMALMSNVREKENQFQLQMSNYFENVYNDQVGKPVEDPKPVEMEQDVQISQVQPNQYTDEIGEKESNDQNVQVQQTLSNENGENIENIENLENDIQNVQEIVSNPQIDPQVENPQVDIVEEKQNVEEPQIEQNVGNMEENQNAVLNQGIGNLEENIFSNIQQNQQPQKEQPQPEQTPPNQEQQQPDIPSVDKNQSTEAEQQDKGSDHERNSLVDSISDMFNLSTVRSDLQKPKENCVVQNGSVLPEGVKPMDMKRFYEKNPHLRPENQAPAENAEPAENLENGDSGDVQNNQENPIDIDDEAEMIQLQQNYQNNLNQENENDEQSRGSENLNEDEILKDEFEGDDLMEGNLEQEEAELDGIQDANTCHYQGCTYRYQNRTTLTGHLKKAHGEGDNLMEFKQVHSIKQASGYRFQCNFLADQSSNQRDNGVYDQCGKKFKQPLELQIHIIKNHSKQNEIVSEMSDKNKCEQCHKVFQDEQQLHDHVEKMGSHSVLANRGKGIRTDFIIPKNITFSFMSDNLNEFAKRLKQNTADDTQDTYMCLLYKRDKNANIQDCKTVIKSTSGMKNHLRDHHSNYKHYTCQLCEEKFQHSKNVLDHRLLAHAQLLINNQILSNNKNEDDDYVKIENINDLHDMVKFQDRREQQFFCDKFKNSNTVSCFGQEKESLIIKEQNLQKCPEICKSSREMNNHTILKHADQISNHQCKVCKLYNYSYHYMKNHVVKHYNGHLPVKKFYNYECEMNLYFKANATLPRREQIRAKCGMRFVSSMYRDLHQQRDHDMRGCTRNFKQKCPYCDLIMPDLKKLKMHLHKGHNEQYRVKSWQEWGMTIPVDVKPDMLKTRFQSYMIPQQHIGDDINVAFVKYECVIVTNYNKNTMQKRMCGQKLNTVHQLKDHRNNIHRNIKCFVCSMKACKSVFKTWKMLELHMEQHKMVTKV